MEEEKIIEEATSEQEGLNKFIALANSLIDCVNYLQTKRNNMGDAIKTVLNFSEGILHSKIVNKHNEKPIKDIFIYLIEQMEFNREYTRKELKIMLNNDSYHILNMNQYLSMFVNMGILKRVRPGVYVRLV